MKVTPISVTIPLIEGMMSGEDLIVHNARVSNPSNQLNLDTGPKLLAYCVKHEHWSPFEQASMGVEIVTSRMISAQILRHKSFSFQEFSQRYSRVQNLEPVEMRKQADKNRQSSEEVLDDPYCRAIVNQASTFCQDSYDKLIARGVARECARAVLPLSAQTTLYMTGTARSWIHYIQLRTKQDTQKEHRDIAEAIKVIFKKEFPVTYSALFESNGR